MVMVLVEVQNANVLPNSAYIFSSPSPFLSLVLSAEPKQCSVLTNVSDLGGKMDKFYDLFISLVCPSVIEASF